MKKLPRVTCTLCGHEYIKDRDIAHQNSPECQSFVNIKQAEADGYIMYYGRYNAGHVSRVEWAKPFIKQYLTGILGVPGDSELQQRWWALKWWLPIAAWTKDMPTAKRTVVMTDVLIWWEAGDLEQIDAMIGGLELAKEPL